MKILVIGDKCTDVFVYGSVDRICPEAPVPVMVSHREESNPGMAGNVYENVKSICSSFFKDKYDIKLISNENNIYKTRYVDEKSNQMLCRVDSNDYSEQSFDSSMIDENYDAIIVADYNKGFLSEDDLELLSQIAPYTFIDTKKRFGDWILGYTYIKINEKEWDENSDWEKIDQVHDRCIVTLGSKGSRLNGDLVDINRPVEVLDLSGAGDTYMAAFAMWFLENGTPLNAMNFANTMASKVVSKQGVTIP
jgi:D-beta-D-heptose 7-phosphate kinase/D-beta-D-heptose 1-phosphate adenosyltransferase